MKKWTEYSKENAHLDQLELKPDVDYTISRTDNNNVIEGAIKCRCGTRIRLNKTDEKQLPNNTSSNDNNNNADDDDRSTASSSITPQQPLSIINAPTSQTHKTNTISLPVTSGTKRNSSSLKATNSQPSSTKRHKI